MRGYELKNNNKKHNNELMIAKYLLAIIALIFLIMAIPNTSEDETEEKVSINAVLVGSENVSVPVNTIYLDEGFDLIVGSEIISHEDLTYIIDGEVDYSVIGEYVIQYVIDYNYANYLLERKISVIDVEAPVIKVNTDVVEGYTCKNKGMQTNLSYVVMDNYDGVITDKTKETVSDDKVHLSVTDSSGNTATLELPYVKTKTPAPVIKLKGNNLVYVKRGSTYKDEGVNVADPCGKVLKREVNVINNVDTNMVGTYTVKYEYTYDKKTLTKERTVIVYDYVDRITNGKDSSKRVVYLTFDDGPGRYTEEILKTLAKYNVKATFFVTNQFKNYVPLIKNIAAQGHTVAVHTLTHKWGIYSSLETYLKDFNDMNDIIYQYSGKKTELYRFPGGSSNSVSKQYATGVVSAISSHLASKGYVVFDWNVDSGDASGASRDKVVKNVIDGIKGRDVSVVLMHDIKKATADGLAEILEYGIDNGYEFLPLDKNSPTIHHSIKN